ncbi:MAG TPA: hypothetical protein VEL28_19550 [Candidatus Binatia bacterium]|nr:hypothetical protein [Candidatus Binatia bacterium]
MIDSDRRNLFVLLTVAATLVEPIPASATLATIGREVRPSVAERIDHACTGADGVTSRALYRCETYDESGICNSPSGLFVEWHDSEGEPVGAAVLANDVHVDAHEPYQAIACDDTGALLVMFSGRVRVIDRNGPRGPSAPVCTHDRCHVYEAAATAVAGHFVIAFLESGVNFHQARRVHADGSLAGDVLPVPTDGFAPYAEDMAAGADAAGNVLIAWRGRVYTEDWRGIQATLLRADSTFEDVIRLSEYGSGEFDRIGVRSAAPEQFIVLWNNSRQAGWVARRVSGEANVPTTTTTTTTADPEVPVFLPDRRMSVVSGYDWAPETTQPVLVGDISGRWLAGWPDYVADSGSLAWTYSRSNDGRVWSGRETIDPQAEPWWHSSAVAGRKDVRVMAWATTSPGAWSLWSRRSTDGGGTWSPARLLYDPAPGPHEALRIEGVRMAAGAGGRILAVWPEHRQEYSRKDDEYRYVFCGLRSALSTNDGRTWSDARVVATTGCNGVPAYEVATDDDGNWLIAWSDGGIIGTHSSNDANSWTAPQRLVSWVHEARSLDVATDDAGGWLLAFSGTIPEADGHSRARIFVSRTGDLATGWSEPAPIAPWHDKEGGSDAYPSIAASRKDRWGIVWSSHDVPGGGMEGDVVAAYSSDGGVTWTNPHAVDADAGSDAKSDLTPELVHTRAETWGVLWRAFENVENSDATTFRFARTRGPCGNGTLEADELCDDANTTDGDGCDSNCTATGCGNAILTLGEQCDDGNAVETDECISTCRLAICGDGFHQFGESCDDGNDSSSDSCLTDCTDASCGDGSLWTGVEECDDGTSNDYTHSCRDDCTLGFCGDGFRLDGQEECDDGNVANGDRCTKRCRLDPVCGRGIGSSQGVTSSDALIVLRKAVGFNVKCPPQQCDRDGNGNITAADALHTLRFAVGLMSDGCGRKRMLVIRLMSDELLGALQVRLDYSATSGDVSIVGRHPVCEITAPVEIAAAGIDGGRGNVSVGFVSLDGFRGPTELVRCEFRGLSEPTPDQLVLMVVDASNPDFEPQTPRVEVVIE